MSTALHLSVDEFNRMVEVGAFAHLNRKIELIRGEIREMSPAGPLHNDLIMFLNNWSVRSTDPEVITVTVQTGLELVDQKSIPEPDLMWLRADRYRKRHPTAADVRLAIEVSDSSLRSDLGEKAELYAEAGIIEFWIIDAQRQRIHVFRGPDPRTRKYNHERIAQIGDHLSPLEPCSTPLDIRQLFIGA